MSRTAIKVFIILGMVILSPLILPIIIGSIVLYKIDDKTDEELLVYGLFVLFGCSLIAGIGMLSLVSKKNKELQNNICPKCGGIIAKMGDSLECKHCGYIIHLLHIECPNCKQKLKVRETIHRVKCPVCNFNINIDAQIIKDEPEEIDVDNVRRVKNNVWFKVGLILSIIALIVVYVTIPIVINNSYSSMSSQTSKEIKLDNNNYLQYMSISVSSNRVYANSDYYRYTYRYYVQAKSNVSKISCHISFQTNMPKFGGSASIIINSLSTTQSITAYQTVDYPINPTVVSVSGMVTLK